jgi:mannose-6-phosphate isomerase
MKQLQPLRMDDNRVPVYYAGGANISAFRGSAGVDGPEDWVASLCALPPAILPFGAPPDTGISRTPDGGSLRDLVAADPLGWLGPALAAAFAGESGLLVKLLDAGERLPVHCHPTRDFARRYLGSIFGKTEGWIIMSAGPDARIWVGLRDGVDRAELRRWIDGQDSAPMLAAMNEVPVYPGQVVYVPSGVPHSIGPGIMLTELQEPTSFSVLAEHSAFGVVDDAATLGLGWEVALSCFDLGAYSHRLDDLLPQPATRLVPGGTVEELFPARAAEFFRASRVSCHGELRMDETSFAVVVITGGRGRMSWGDGDLAATAGETYVVPFGAGPLGFVGDVQALICLPPAVSTC